MSHDDPLTAVRTQLVALRDDLAAAAARERHRIDRVHPRHRAAATNLVHYVELRRHDIRGLQRSLARAGLSSLGAVESAVLPSIEAVLAVLAVLQGDGDGPGPSGVEVGSPLAAHAERLLGPQPPHRRARIMVTLPSEAADHPDLAASLVHAGMDVARINCAHDHPDDWARMAAHVRAAGPCRIAMDLAGPKLRTGPLAPGPRVVRVAPTRDALGRVLAPALVWLVACGRPGSITPVDSAGAPDPAAPSLHDATVVPVDDAPWVTRREPGDVVHLVDARGARRRWTVHGAADGACLVAVDDTAYVVAGTMLVDDTGMHAPVGALPETEQALVIRPGDTVVLTRDLTPAPVPEAPGTHHRLGCTLPEAFDHVRPGQRVWFDDGKVGGTVTAVTGDEIAAVVTHAKRTGSRLRAQKGINFPDTDLPVPAMTAKDAEDLIHVARLADMVDASFVRSAADVAALIARLDDLGAHHLGLVLKVETRAAFEHLPDLLLEAMRRDPVGVMIARGDLAVELGFVRLAEVQEEILWLCEAAQVPVIWATQVLDGMARTGMPSRAEVTDAAMADRAECVMLNKGEHVVDAITALDAILSRMQDHQHKKRSLLRRLRAWDGPGG